MDFAIHKRGEHRSRLFRKYATAFVILVSGALLVSGFIEIYYSYQENQRALARVQQEKATAAAGAIRRFLAETERQIRWTLHPTWPGAAPTTDRRSEDLDRLLRLAPEITEIAYIDRLGREQIRVSRLTTDVTASQADYSREPQFQQARVGAYYGPVYFRNESEPYMTMAIAEAGPEAGVVAAEVNLKFVRDVVSGIDLGRAGQAYAVDAHGRLVTHSDISLVLQGRDASTLEQVQMAQGSSRDWRRRPAEATIASDLYGRQVLTAWDAIQPLGWSVFVENPLEEAFAPLYASIFRTALLLVLGLVTAALVSLFLARRMVTPIRALQAGAARIGAGSLDRRIEVRTGDELEALAEEFNQMTAQLQQSYATLERRVEERTRDLAESLEQQTATSEVLRVIASSPTGLERVLQAIIDAAARLCDAPSAALMQFRERDRRLSPRATVGAARTQNTRDHLDFENSPGVPTTPTSGPGRAYVEARTIHIHDLAEAVQSEYPESRWIQDQLGQRTVVNVPMLRHGASIGVLAMHRFEVRPFTEQQIALLEMFADQAVIAIENARLFEELRDRVDELRALGEVGQALSSSLDLEMVLSTIVGNATRLAAADGGLLYEFDVAEGVFEVRAGDQVTDDLAATLRAARFRLGEGAVGQAGATRAPVQVTDIEGSDVLTPHVRDRLLAQGMSSVLAVPLLREDQVLGGLVMLRRTPGAFPGEVVALLQTLATQSALAIHNARLYAALEVQGRALETASQHKSAFLANMSHELRTGLLATIGFSELLLEGVYGDLAEEQAGSVRDILSAGQHVLSLINDALDLSKVEAGRMELELGRVSLLDVFEQGRTLLKELSGRHGIVVEVAADPTLEPIEADERKVKQIIFNLLSNAVKFTPDGGHVEITAQRVDHEVHVAVRDTGVGIAAGDQERIFEEFRRVGAGARKAEGTGLGLALTRKLVELHGGRIWVESELGTGSTFTLALPLRHATGTVESNLVAPMTRRDGTG